MIRVERAFDGPHPRYALVDDVLGLHPFALVTDGGMAQRIADLLNSPAVIDADDGALPGLGLPLDDAGLIALAKTLSSDHVRWCARVLAFNRMTPAIRDACRRDLRAALKIPEPTE